MKREIEKMRSEELYDFSDPESDATLRHAKQLCARLQTVSPYDASSGYSDCGVREAAFIARK